MVLAEGCSHLGNLKQAGRYAALHAPATAAHAPIVDPALRERAGWSRRSRTGSRRDFSRAALPSEKPQARPAVRPNDAPRRLQILGC